MTTEPRAEGSSDAALVARVPGATPPVPVEQPAPAQVAQEELTWTARGAAKVGKPRTVRARAAVPGALSIPRPRPSRLPRLGRPSMPFPRRVFPQAVRDEIEPPPLRAAIPGPSGRSADGLPGVREKAVDLVPKDDVRKDGSHPVREKSLPRRAALPAVTATVAALVAGAAYLAVTDRSPSDLGRWGAVAESTAPPATTTSAKPAERPAGDPFGEVAAVPAGLPTRVRIGAIKVDTSLETLRIGGDGALQPPRDFARAGWYADGTAPGDTGPAVIAGHVDSKSGPAVFYRLRELTSGDRIEVVRGGAAVRFTVTAVRWYPKSEFPTEEVYGPTPDRQLRLITCGGVFDRTLRSYRDNLVVYAVAG